MGEDEPASVVLLLQHKGSRSGALIGLLRRPGVEIATLPYLHAGEARIAHEPRDLVTNFSAVAASEL